MKIFNATKASIEGHTLDTSPYSSIMIQAEEISCDNITWSQVIEALEQSVKLQVHYAKVLNAIDGGKRIIFNDHKEWIDRLSKTKERY